MWESFPIQTRSDEGPDCQTIDPTFQYTRHPDVQVMKWKDAPANIRQWCVSLWKDTFDLVRDPVASADLLGWIPGVGTIVANYGRWIGATRSRRAVYINYLVVAEGHRNGGIAEKLIHSVCAEACVVWGSSTAFLFEVNQIPGGLSRRGAPPVCRFSYVWVPFTSISRPPKWKPANVKKILPRIPGFYGAHTGWKAYTCGSDSVLFDAHNDIVWVSSMLSLATFDGFPAAGAYYRMFSSFGTFAVFAENMYHAPISGHIML